ncbi:hypothetical protein OIU76_016888 [Salix suchowensis]|nr:hypothetical protein OIU76_016888 [Salix suchowensis]
MNSNIWLGLILDPRIVHINVLFKKQMMKGYTGVSLSRSIPQVAGEALKTNMTTLAALALPYSELIQYGLSVMWKKVWPPAKKRGSYIPDFKKAFDHFCIHAGGRAVIGAIKEFLKLKDRDVVTHLLHQLGTL